MMWRLPVPTTDRSTDLATRRPLEGLDSHRPITEAPSGGPGGFLVEHGRGWRGRARWTWAGRRHRQRRRDHLRCGRAVAERGVRPRRVVVFAPPLDQHLRFPERVEHLGPQQLVAYVCSVTPIDRTASATDLPCAASTSTCRSLATISSGVCAFFLPIHEPPFASAAHIAGGPLLGGQVTSPTRLKTSRSTSGSGCAATAGSGPTAGPTSSRWSAGTRGSTSWGCGGPCGAPSAASRPSPAGSRRRSLAARRSPASTVRMRASCCPATPIVLEATPWN
jgi:hypothetical protein